MTSKKTAASCSPGVRERSVRLVLDGAGEHGSQWAAIGSIAGKIGCTASRKATPEASANAEGGKGGKTLQRRVRQAERDRGKRAGPMAEERDRIKSLERENREPRQANEILRKASPASWLGGVRPPVEAKIAFIDDHRGEHGVEPLCRVLPIAPSTCDARAAKRAGLTLGSARSQRHAMLRAELRRVRAEDFGVSGVRKVWRQLGREGTLVARCTVARLMRRMGLRGVVRGKETRTTVPDRGAPCAADRVDRQFLAPRPNLLWVSDFTCVATWQRFVHVALPPRGRCLEAHRRPVDRTSDPFPSSIGTGAR